MSNKQLIKQLIDKYVITIIGGDKIVPKIEWHTWKDCPAWTQPALFEFHFEGDFIEKLTTTETKILALHEIAHYNSFFSDVKDNFKHGDPINELIFIVLYGKEGINHTRVNVAIHSIHSKWAMWRRDK